MTAGSSPGGAAAIGDLKAEADDFHRVMTGLADRGEVPPVPNIRALNLDRVIIKPTAMTDALVSGRAPARAALAAGISLNIETTDTVTDAIIHVETP